MWLMLDEPKDTETVHFVDDPSNSVAADIFLWTSLPIQSVLLLLALLITFSSSVNARSLDDLVVWIECADATGKTYFGNGVVVSNEGHVLTAAHVYPGRGSSCTGMLSGEEFKLQPRAQSFDYDGMLMELLHDQSAILDYATYCPIGADMKGREIRALSFHKGATAEPSETNGIISRTIEKDGKIPTTAMVIAGKSGGPVFLKDTSSIVGIVAGASFDSTGVPIEYSITAAASLSDELGRMVESDSCAPPAKGYTIEQHEQKMAERLAETRATYERLIETEQRASAAEKRALQAEKQALLQEIDSQSRDLADLEASFEERGNKLATVRAKLEALQDGTVSQEELRKAELALAQGDTNIAEEIFRQISEAETAATQRKAIAEFGLGTIAADKHSWSKAAEHYKTAANLDPIYAHLYKASEYAGQIGDYVTAQYFSRDLVKTARAEYGDGTEALAAALNEVAVSLQGAGQFEEAEAHYREAMIITASELGKGHPAYGSRLNNLATVLVADGRYDEAEPLFRKAIKNAQWTIGVDNADYAERLNNYAALLAQTNRLSEAERFYQASIEISKRFPGVDHPDYATRLSNYAALLVTDRRYHDAEDLFLKALEIAKRTVGEAHPAFATSLNNLGELMIATNREKEAIEHFTQAYEIFNASLGSGNAMTLKVKRNLDAARQG